MDSLYAGECSKCSLLILSKEKLEEDEVCARCTIKDSVRISKEEYADLLNYKYMYESCNK